MADDARDQTRLQLEERMESGRTKLDAIEQALSAAIQQLRGKLAEAEQRFGANNPEVIKMRAEIEQSEREAQDHLEQSQSAMAVATDEARTTFG